MVREATLPRAWLVPFLVFVVVSLGESVVCSVNAKAMDYLRSPVRLVYGLLVLAALVWLVAISAQDATPKRAFWYGLATGTMGVAAMLVVDVPYANSIYHAAHATPVWGFSALARLSLGAVAAGLVLGGLVAAAVRLVQGRQG
ncbi:hypothetical protein LLH03_01480 [bacterium]|nr:hypothetical protein [bacterium]